MYLIIYLFKFLSYLPAFVFSDLLFDNVILQTISFLVFCAICFFISISKVNFIVMPIIWIASIVLGFIYYPLWFAIIQTVIFAITVIRFIILIIANIKSGKENNESN